jgi:hypothetical protein
MTRVVVLLCLAVTLSAAANDETNVLPVLTIKGASYTNARITSFTPADAIVVFDGGGLRAQWSDFPPSLQKRYGYDPVKAREYLAAKNQKRPAAVAQASPKPATDPTGAPQPAVAPDPPAERHRMRVINIVATNIYARCLVSLDGSQREILLDRLPPPVRQSFEGLYSFQAMLAQFGEKVEADKKKAEAENAAAPASVVGDMDARHVQERINQRGQAELDLVKARREEEDLAQMKSYLKTLRDQNQKTANIIALPTGKSFAGAEIWKCLGQAP